MSSAIPNLEHVRTFVAIVDAGGFQSAGLHLELAQPTVSHHLRKLESFLGAQLLVREPGSMALTRHGQSFLPGARSLLRAASHAVGLLRGQQPAVGASSNVGIYMLQRHLRRYREAHEPDGGGARLRIGTNPDVQHWLLHGEVDLAVVEWWRPAAGFEATTWREERLVVILPPGHRWADRPALPVDVLFEEPLLAGEASTGTGTLLREALGPDAARVRVLLELGSTEAVKQAVMAGHGISLVLESAVEDERRASSLLVRPIEGAHLAKRILIVLPEGTPATAPARDLVNLLMSPEKS